MGGGERIALGLGVDWYSAATLNHVISSQLQYTALHTLHTLPSLDSLQACKTLHTAHTENYTQPPEHT